MCRLITDRLAELLNDTDGEYEWTELVRFALVEPGDDTKAIEAAAGYPVVTSLAFEWVRDHGFALEGAVVLSDDGFGLIVLAAIAEGMCPELLNVMRL
jgi:hypothetical protein